MLSKEPETIEWLNSLDKGAVLWDIGANVGIYTIYAADAGLDVVAIEPMPSNYYTLTKNIEVNNLSEKVSAFCFALTNEVCIDFFYISTSQIGSSQNSFKENIGWDYKKMENVDYKHSTIGMSIDSFIKLFSPKFPNYIKIDVDGLEKRIILGARETLSDPRLKSMLVELNTAWEDYQDILNFVLGCGFTRWEKKRSEEFDNGEMKDVYNHIFFKG
ncbi:MAG: FkbM family methyltransferase [Sphingobacteriaceae bacterium]|nr:FkbM family methyltransferase [Sphingobacteriaceae bacterium]